MNKWVYLVGDYLSSACLDTGAGVLISVKRGKSSGRAMVFLPGHALINGELVSPPMLAPSEQPGVTMGERVAKLQVTVDQLKDQLRQEEELHRVKVAQLEADLMVARGVAKRLTDEKAANALSLVNESGALSHPAKQKKGFLSFLKK